MRLLWLLVGGADLTQVRLPFVTRILEKFFARPDSDSEEGQVQVFEWFAYHHLFWSSDVGRIRTSFQRLVFPSTLLYSVYHSSLFFQKNRSWPKIPVLSTWSFIFSRSLSCWVIWRFPPLFLPKMGFWNLWSDLGSLRPHFSPLRAEKIVSRMLLKSILDIKTQALK